MDTSDTSNKRYSTFAVLSPLIIIVSGVVNRLEGVGLINGLGLIGPLFQVSAIPAGIVFGVIGLFETRNNKTRGRRYAIAGILLGIILSTYGFINLLHGG